MGGENTKPHEGEREDVAGSHTKGRGKDQEYYTGGREVRRWRGHMRG